MRSEIILEIIKVYHRLSPRVSKYRDRGFEIQGEIFMDIELFVHTYTSFITSRLDANAYNSKLLTGKREATQKVKILKRLKRKADEFNTEFQFRDDPRERINITHL